MIYDHGLRSRSTVTICAHDLRSQSAFTIYDHGLRSRSMVTVCAHDLRPRSTLRVCAHDLRSRSALTIYGDGLRSRFAPAVYGYARSALTIYGHGLRSRSEITINGHSLCSLYDLRSWSALTVCGHDLRRLRRPRSQSALTIYGHGMRLLSALAIYASLVPRSFKLYVKCQVPTDCAWATNHLNIIFFWYFWTFLYEFNVYHRIPHGLPQLYFCDTKRLHLTLSLRLNRQVSGRMVRLRLSVCAASV